MKLPGIRCLVEKKYNFDYNVSYQGATDLVNPYGLKDGYISHLYGYTCFYYENELPQIIFDFGEKIQFNKIDIFFNPHNTTYNPAPLRKKRIFIEYEDETKYPPRQVISDFQSFNNRIGVKDFSKNGSLIEDNDGDIDVFSILLTQPVNTQYFYIVFDVPFTDEPIQITEVKFSLLKDISEDVINLNFSGVKDVEKKMKYNRLTLTLNDVELKYNVYRNEIEINDKVYIDTTNFDKEEYKPLGVFFVEEIQNFTKERITNVNLVDFTYFLSVMYLDVEKSEVLQNCGIHEIIERILLQCKNFHSAYYIWDNVGSIPYYLPELRTFAEELEKLVESSGDCELICLETGQLKLKNLSGIVPMTRQVRYVSDLLRYDNATIEEENKMMTRWDGNLNQRDFGMQDFASWVNFYFNGSLPQNDLIYVPFVYGKFSGIEPGSYRGLILNSSDYVYTYGNVKREVSEEIAEIFTDISFSAGLFGRRFFCIYSLEEDSYLETYLNNDRLEVRYKKPDGSERSITFSIEFMYKHLTKFYIQQIYENREYKIKLGFLLDGIWYENFIEDFYLEGKVKVELTNRTDYTVYFIQKWVFAERKIAFWKSSVIDLGTSKYIEYIDCVRDTEGMVMYAKFSNDAVSFTPWQEITDKKILSQYRFIQIILAWWETRIGKKGTLYTSNVVYNEQEQVSLYSKVVNVYPENLGYSISDSYEGEVKLYNDIEIVKNGVAKVNQEVMNSIEVIQLAINEEIELDFVYDKTTDKNTQILYVKVGENEYQFLPGTSTQNGLQVSFIVFPLGSEIKMKNVGVEPLTINQLRVIADAYVIFSKNLLKYRDLNSIQNYGLLVKKIENKNIQTVAQAESVARKFLRYLSYPYVRLTERLDFWYNNEITNDCIILIRDDVNSIELRCEPLVIEHLLDVNTMEYKTSINAKIIDFTKFGQSGGYWGQGYWGQGYWGGG